MLTQVLAVEDQVVFRNGQDIEGRTTFMAGYYAGQTGDGLQAFTARFDTATGTGRGDAIVTPESILVEVGDTIDGKTVTNISDSRITDLGLSFRGEFQVISTV